MRWNGWFGLAVLFASLVLLASCGGGGGTPPTGPGGGDDGGGGGGGGGGDGDTDGGGETLALFEQVWTDFDRNYSHFGIKNVDWDAVYFAYRPLFLEELTTTVFLDRIATMLSELQDLHVYLLDPGGNPAEVYSRAGARNWLGGYLPKYFPHGVTRLAGKYPLRHGWLDQGQTLAYLSIETFSSAEWDGLMTSELNALFQTYAAAAGMVVDVRPNNGGSEIVARAIAGYLAGSNSVRYGYTETRIAGDDHDAFEPPVDHILEPAASYRYTGDVVVLMGEVNMSSAEWFIMMMDNCPNTYLMGDVTRGSSGNPQEFTLANGIAYGIPSWIATGERWDYTLVDIEDNGIEPYQHWTPAASYDEGLERDYLLEAAIARLSP